MATLIEFDDDGGTTTYEAVDYLSRERHTSLQQSSTDDLDLLIHTYSRLYDVDDRLVRAIIAVESNFNRDAVSPKGAIGLMQLMPATSSIYKVEDAFDPEQNIRAGTIHISRLLKKFNGDLDLALAAYNAGEGSVRKYKGVPPFQETELYIHKVKSHLAK